MAPRDEQDELDPSRTDKPAGSDLSRRNFLKTVGAAGVATTVGDAAVQAQRGAQQPVGTPRQTERGYTPIRHEVAGNLIKRGIVGYADHLRVQPGDTIKFMVSSERSRYRADIVRLIHGDANPKGPGIKEIVIETPANNDYSGRRQELPLGSYAIVPDNSALRISGSFTFTAWIAPTSQRGDGADVFSGVEGILTKAGGYAVVIDEAGRLSLWLTAADGRTEKIAAGQPLRTWVPAIPGMNARPQGVTTVWSFVAVSFDAASGKVILHQDPLNDFPFDASRGVSERSTTITAIATSDAPLLLAALRDPSGKIAGHYNGKIDNPRLYRRVLSPQEIAAIAQGRGPYRCAHLVGLLDRHRDRSHLRYLFAQAARPHRQPADAGSDGSQLDSVRDGLQARPLAVRRDLLSRRRHRRCEVGRGALNFACRQD